MKDDNINKSGNVCVGGGGCTYLCSAVFDG